MACSGRVYEVELRRVGPASRTRFAPVARRRAGTAWARRGVSCASPRRAEPAPLCTITESGRGGRRPPRDGRVPAVDARGTHCPELHLVLRASRGGGAWCAGASDASGRAAAKERPAKTRKPCGRLRRDGWKGCGRGVGALVWCGSRLREVTRMWYPPSAMCGRVEHCRTAMRVADRRRVSMSIRWLFPVLPCSY